MPVPPNTLQPTAPGWPGLSPRWTSSVKSGVGTALASASRVWFSLSHGIVDEVYYPRVDSACTRDCGLIVTDGASYFSEEKRHALSRVSFVSPGVPAYRLENTAADGRYRIEKEILTDSAADVLLQRIRFHALDGATAFRLFVLLAPHLNNRGAGNTAWVGDYKGVPMLFAERDTYALALACSVPWLARSVGFVGSSDGWQELHAHGSLATAYERAENGNVALTGEIDLSAGESVLAMGFGASAEEAGQRAVMSLLNGFDAASDEYIARWHRWQGARRRTPVANPQAYGLDDFSAAVLRIHESKSVGGGVIASLSIPWGFEKGDDDLGGYHLVWPRDLVEAAGGFLAAGAINEARRVLQFLHATQEPDGHWSQNMWLDGTPYWTGIQMDETALPILLVDLAARAGALSTAERQNLSPMVQRAAGFLVRSGPVSPQDRWEEDPGYSPFTVGAEIAALLAAAEDAETNGNAAGASYLRETADAWYLSIDDWMYVTDTTLAQQCGVEGYYVRVTAPEEADAASPKGGFVPIKNRPPDECTAPASLTVSPDALALVRFGLRDARDPRVKNTVAVIDAVLEVATPYGPAWHRYNGDGYGEHEDGSPFDGTGVGRAWPLLTGERAHYELAAGQRARAEALARAMEGFAGDCLLLPEQVWDAASLPQRELLEGEASGSARPLVWAHAEYLKLRRSIEDGQVFDRPMHTVERYLSGGAPDAPYAVWRFNNKIRRMVPGKTLRLETLARATVKWGWEGDQMPYEMATVDTGFGVHVADLETARRPAGETIAFTFFWQEGNRWEGTTFHVVIEES